MASIDPGPSSSYSDPLYDRLDLLVRALRQRWVIYLVGVLIVVALAVAARSWLSARTDQASVAAFELAEQAHDPSERISQLQALAQDPHADPYYRARAWIELTQHRLDTDNATTAEDAARNAVAEAKNAHDPELRATAQLSLAGAEYQAQDDTAALADYQAVEGATARYPVLQLEAILGEARAEQHLHQIPQAIQTLEPLLSRTDEAAKTLLDMARVMYWDLKREQMLGGAHPTLAPPTSATGSATASATGAGVSAAPAPIAPPTRTTAPAPATAAPAARPPTAPSPANPQH